MYPFSGAGLISLVDITWASAGVNRPSQPANFCFLSGVGLIDFNSFTASEALRTEGAEPQPSQIVRWREVVLTFAGFITRGS